MNEFNPYAPPEAPIGPALRPGAGAGELFRDGKALVFAKGTELPDRCLRCNEPAGGYRLRRTLYWHPPGWYLLLIGLGPGLLLYVLVALLVRHKGRVAAPFCARHRARRRWTIALGWLSCLGFGWLMAVGFSDRNPVVGMLGFLLLMVSLIVSVLLGQFVVPQRIDRSFIWLGKVGPAFLADLPDWQTVGLRSLTPIRS